MPDANSESHDAPLFARTGVVGPFGSLEEDLKTKVDFDTAQAFRRLCAEAGTDVSGGLRAFVYWRTHGKTYEQLQADAAERRTAVLIGTGPEHVLMPLPVLGEVNAR